MAYAIDTLVPVAVFRVTEQAMEEAIRDSMQIVVMFWVVRMFQAARGRPQHHQLYARLESLLTHTQAQLNASTAGRGHTLRQVPKVVQNVLKAHSNHPKRSKNV